MERKRGLHSAFLTGIRNLRSSFLTGALLLASIYILFLDGYASTASLRPAATRLLELHSSMPLLIAGIAAYIVGSLYVTALEGFVDLAHRKLLFASAVENKSASMRHLYAILAPLSDSARHRLDSEAEAFFWKHSPELNKPSHEKVSEFKNHVFADVLWMEGKLTGTSLRDTYSEYRAEGEFRLAVGLLLPIVAITVSYAASISGVWFYIMFVVAAAIALQTCNYGLYYFRKAHSFLAHHVADGSLLTPTMETLQRINSSTIDLPKPVASEVKL